MKNTSCAIFIESKAEKTFLLCHATNTKHWSLPKGVFDKDEDSTFLEAAVREVREETGIEIHDTWNVSFVDKFNYHPEKDLVIYYYQIDNEIPINELKCKSYFMDTYSSRQKPEVDNYVWENFDNIQTNVSKKQLEILKSKYFKKRIEMIRDSYNDNN